MKKIVLLMMMMSMVAFGGVKSELKKDENGRYSGSATLSIVARGRIVNPVSTKMLVISSENNDSLELSHKGVKEGESNIVKEKFNAQILEKNEKGEYVVSKERKNIVAKLVDKENMTEIANSEREVKNLEGKNVAKVSYGLKNKSNKNGYIGEISSKVIADKNSNGVFIDNSAAIAILVK